MNNVVIRQLEEKDLFNGFLNSLDSLRKTSSIETNKAKQIFEKIHSNPDHIILVAVLNNKIVGSTTLLMESKFIHHGGKVCHIEDVVVNKENQGEGIGEKLILASLEYAKNANCYKTILNCEDSIKPYYEKIGFKSHSSEMRFDH